VDAVLYAPDLLTSHFARDLIARLGRFGSAQREPQSVSAQVMESLADKDNPQGILAIVRQKQIEIEHLKDVRTATALVSPQDPGNVGTILRTLDAVERTRFSSSMAAELYHPTVVRSSMGTIF
jgi:TrmH family RNA methyltransferase